MASSWKGPDPGLVAALVAIAGIGNLVALTVLGILVLMPLWAAVLLVVGELLAPLLIHLAFYKLLRIPLPWGLLERFAF